MRIVIIGAGAVGSYLAEKLSYEGQDVVVIESEPPPADSVSPLSSPQAVESARSIIAGIHAGRDSSYDRERGIGPPAPA